MSRERHHNLRQVFRQTDQAFVDILEQLRRGVVRPEAIRVLQGLQKGRMYVDGRSPTEL